MMGGRCLVDRLNWYSKRPPFSPSNQRIFAFSQYCLNFLHKLFMVFNMKQVDILFIRWPRTFVPRRVSKVSMSESCSRIISTLDSSIKACLNKIARLCCDLELKKFAFWSKSDRLIYTRDGNFTSIKSGQEI
jgi:hypothetical protein